MHGDSFTISPTKLPAYAYLGVDGLGGAAGLDTGAADQERNAQLLLITQHLARAEAVRADVIPTAQGAGGGR